jgi:hypothetical protein
MLSVGELKAFEFASGAIASILAAFMLAHLVGIPSLMKPRKYQKEYKSTPSLRNKCSCITFLSVSGYSQQG